MESIFRKDLLAGRVAFVTGGGSGICQGMARAMMAHGADAVIVGRKADRLEAAAKAMSEETGRQCLAAPADVREPEQVAAALDAAIARFGKVDIVVNGAAGNFLAPAAALSPRGFKTVLDIDTAGTFNVSRLAFEKCLSEKGGVIINVSATLHYAATPLQIHASAAKAAIDAMTRTLAVEWGPSKVRVVGIAPGPIDDTEGMAKLAPGDVKAKLERVIPLGRFGRIDEMGTLAVFLASDGAAYIHGTTVVADGGAWMTMSLGLLE
ncbi:MAG: SDR family oxidoreductase [Polyangiales bacterium]